MSIVESDIQTGHYVHNGHRLPVVAIVRPWMMTSTIRLGVAFGARHDPIAASGTAHLLEHVLLSNPTSNGASFCEQVENLGGFANATTGIEDLSFICQTAADDASSTLDTLLRSIFQPQWCLATYNRELTAILREIETEKADSRRQIRSRFLKNLFQDHPLGNPVSGNPDEIANITLEQLVAHYSRDFLSKRMVLVLVGPTVPIEIGSSTIDRDCADDPIHLAISPQNLQQVDRWPAEYSWACIGSRAVSAGSRYRPSYQVLSELFGSSPSSILYKVLRSQHMLTYEFGSWYRGYEESGSWRVFLGAHKRHGFETINRTVDLIHGVAKHGVDDELLAAAKRRAILRLIRESDEPLSHSRNIQSHGRVAKTHWSIKSEISSIDLVCNDDILEVSAQVSSGLTLTY